MENAGVEVQQDFTDAVLAGDFRALFGADVGVAQTEGSNRRIVGVNRHFSTMLGYDHDELVGTALDVLLHSGDTAEGEALYTEAAANGTAVREARLIKKCGEPVWVRVQAALVRDADGNTHRAVALIHDLTKARAAAEANAAARVGEAVAAREATLAQSYEAQKMETIGQLTGGVAHDFNNLLTPIIGSLDLLRRRQPDERGARLIDNALVAADRARLLVQRLLAFSRRQSLETRAVDVAALVRNMREVLARAVGADLPIEVVAGAVPRAEVDPAQFELAVLNLAVNARDAMPSGGTLKIVVDRATELVDGAATAEFVRLAVCDTGTGMDEATCRRAIEPFFTTKGLGRGAGLGLSMVHGLAAQSGGRLVLDSVPGGGTRAELWLPVAVDPSPAPAGPPDGPSPGPRRPEDILLVDDEVLVRGVTAVMLAELGYSVVEAGDAREGLARLEAGDPVDLLVTDYLMPGMNGAEFVHAARRLRPGLPALLLSGYAKAASVDPSLRRLAKPFRQAELGAAVAAALGPVATAK